ncbi:MAG: chorismate--pyruvate lyase family protein [Polynucleobacter victoriensis]
MKKLRQSWVNLDHVALHAAPQIWQDWLSDAGSLTQLITNKTQSPVSVEVLSDRNQNLLNDEALLFNQPINHCRIREVYLCVNDVPVVFARSILPTSSSTGINRDVLQLGSKPLGEVLFKKGKAPILLRQITEVPGLGWGRRSLYQLRGHPILISEFFLPELLAQIKS